MVTNINKSLNSNSSNKVTNSLGKQKELYKELSSKVERYRHLPKIKVNKEHHGLYEPSYQSIDYHHIDDEANSLPYVTYYLFRPVKLSRIGRDSFHKDWEPSRIMQ